MSKEKLPKDQAARDRIASDLKSNLLVEAGAGSGKTHEMAARMAAGVASGDYVVSQMAAVTFTRKAAAELRGRFQHALEAELANVGRGFSPGEAAARTARINAALSNIERFFAGTIHAFCARLLRERPVEAGVSPGFTELDETEEQLLRRQSWRDYRAQARSSGDPDFLELADTGIEAKHLDEAFATICNYEDVDFPAGDTARPDEAKAWKAVEKFWASLKPLIPPAPVEGSKCSTLDRAWRCQRAWSFAARGRRGARQLVELLEIWQSQPKATQKWWPTKSNALAAEALHKEFRTEVVQPFLEQWRAFVYGRLVTVLTRAREHSRLERRRRNTLTFNDLLFITAELLRSNADVRRSLGEKYRWLFVDEFQDTDPVQAEIMFLLASEPVEPDGPDEPAEPDGPDEPADWRSVPLRPGALFVVGDPKQSIYRFRRADIDIYNEVRARLSDGLVQLTTNFRSVPTLCAWANTVFKTRFPAQPTTHAPQFAGLDAHRPSESADPALAVITLQADTVAELNAEEAGRIARYIRSEVHAGRRRFGDFLILTRKRKPLGAYASALEALRIPIEVTGAGAFGESEEVRTLALLLTALADPQDAVSLIGVLRGPLFGVSDQELFEYRQSGGYFGLFSDVGRAFRPGGPVSSALVTLRTWYRWTRVLPAGAALERILEESGYLALAAASPDGVEAGDLLHAVDRIRTILESGFTLADAAETMAEWSGLSDEDETTRESSDVDSLPLQPGRQDVVRLMNLHKAKGLEAPVVFLAAPKSGFSPRADVRIVRTGDSAVGYFRIQKDSDGGWAKKVLAEPVNWEVLEAEELHYLQAESDRLLYVAATRAQDLLIVSQAPGGGRGTPAWTEFNPHLAGVAELPIPATANVPAPVDVDLSASAAAAARAESDALHERARRPSWDAVSVTSEAKALPAVTPGADEDGVPDDDPTRVVTADTPSRRADAGVAWGTLVHGLLEHAMRHQTATRDDLRRLAMWLTMEEPQLRVVIEQALDTVEGVSRGAFWKTARASSEVHEEAPFAIREVRDGLPTVVSGVIDLAYREDKGWRILDYKTDAGVEADELAKRYAAQLEAYRKAWMAISHGQARAEFVPVRR